MLPTVSDKFRHQPHFLFWPFRYIFMIFNGQPIERCLGAIYTPFLTVTAVPQLLATVSAGSFTTGLKSGKIEKCPTDRQMTKSKNLSSTFYPTLIHESSCCAILIGTEAKVSKILLKFFAKTQNYRPYNKAAYFHQEPLQLESTSRLTKYSFSMWAILGQFYQKMGILSLRQKTTNQMIQSKRNEF